jgi:hypothetical protein
MHMMHIAHHPIMHRTIACSAFRFSAIFTNRSQWEEKG